MQEAKGESMRIVSSFSVKAAAKQCSLSERTIHSAIKQGRLTALRVGRRVLVTPAALDDFLHGRTAKSKAGAQ
jgi:excisionase family DNA binding protein